MKGKSNVQAGLLGEYKALQKCFERLTGIFGIPQRKILHINHIENAFGYRRY